MIGENNLLHPATYQTKKDSITALTRTHIPVMKVKCAGYAADLE